MSGPTFACREPGCGQATSEQKPYCFDHLARMPAVAAIMKRTGGREGCEARRASAHATRIEAANRPCASCGGPMPPPKSMGRVPVFCSRRCRAREAQSAHQARVRAARTKAASHAPAVAPLGDHGASPLPSDPTLRAALEHLNTGLRLLADALATKGA